MAYKLQTAIRQAANQLIEAGIITSCKYQVYTDNTAGIEINFEGNKHRLEALTNFDKISVQHCKLKIIELKHWLMDMSQAPAASLDEALKELDQLGYLI